MLWMDLSENETPEEAALLESNFGLHPLAIQDAQRECLPPKIEAFENHTFIFLTGLSVDAPEHRLSHHTARVFRGPALHSGQSLACIATHTSLR